MTFLWNLYLAIVLIIMMCGAFRIAFKIIIMIVEEYRSVMEILIAILMVFLLAAFPLYLLHNGKFAEVFVKAWPF